MFFMLENNPANNLADDQSVNKKQNFFCKLFKCKTNQCACQWFKKFTFRNKKQTINASDTTSLPIDENTATTSIANPKNTKKTLKNWQKFLLVILAILLILISASGVMAYYSYQIAMEIKGEAYQAKFKAQTAYDSFKTQNLPEAEKQLQEVGQELAKIKNSYQKLAFYNNLPIIKNYYQDGLAVLQASEHGLNAGLKAIEAIVPYADVLGFQGEGSFTGGTAENRIKLMLETIDKVSPVFDEIIAQLQLTSDNLEKIDAKRYPEKIADLALRSQIEQVQQMSSEAVTMIAQFKPVIEQLPNIAGAGETGRKKYLILFQNDNELRPTGGFLTAYAVVFIEDGVVTPEKSDDIYELDLKFKKTEAIPEALAVGLTTEKKWNLRDMNIWPDFKKSMDKFFTNYQTVRGEPDNIDGIIAVDTQVLTGLLSVLGPVQIQSGATFSAEIDKRCDCPQVVYALSEIITKPTPYIREDRKGILGPLMQAVLQKAYSAPKEQWPALFDFGWKAILGRHVQMYFNDTQAQLATETVNAGGRLIAPAKGDFLAIVNTNLGGAKSNLFTEYSVKQVVEDAPVDGTLEKTVEITYKNTRKGDNCNLEAGQLCLNASMLDWTRLYVPKGAKLIKAQGFSGETKVYEEDGFTIIEGYFKLEPLGVAKLIVDYTIPYSEEIYKVRLWKQGGVSPFETIFDITGGEEKVLVDRDIDYQVAF